MSFTAGFILILIVAVFSMGLVIFLMRENLKKEKEISAKLFKDLQVRQKFIQRMEEIQNEKTENLDGVNSGFDGSIDVLSNLSKKRS